MKLLSVQGHFGNLNGMKIEFPDGFSRLTLPNGGGKTTLCALIRVLFYGLNLSKRDTARALSDKTKYIPQDGKPMSGRMEIEWNGQRVTIIRKTGKGGPMQDFEAFFTDTGERCRMLSAKNCGQVILGMGEDAFLSTLMIDGEDVMRPSDELQELLSGMAQTGDSRGQYQEARKRLERWRTEIGEGAGEAAHIREELSMLEESRRRLEEVEGQLSAVTAKAEGCKRNIAQAEAEYESYYRSFAETLTGREHHLRILKEEKERQISTLIIGLAEENKIRAAADALLGYEGAVRLEQEKRDAVPLAETMLEQEVQKLDQHKHREEVAQLRRSRPRLHWIALIFSLFFAVSAAVTGIFDISFIEFAYLPYVLSGLAVFCLFLAFLGSVPKPIEPMDFEREKQRLDLEYQQKWQEQQMANSVLAEEREYVMQLAQEAGCYAVTIEEVSAWIREQERDLQLFRKTQSELGDILIELRRREHNPEYREQTDAIEQRKAIIRQEQETLRGYQETIARLRGQMDEIGSRERLNETYTRLQAEQQKFEKRYHAIELAQEVLDAEQEKLRVKLSPEITARTNEYMKFLTASRYREIRIDEKLRVSTGVGDGVLLDELRLSTGTRDQLYLALRLAVCDMLAQGVPLILDDPFITSDDERTARGIELLRHLARERQIILLTCRNTANL